MGNEYGVSPLTMLQLFSPMFVILPVVVWLWLIGPLLLYPVARWKANREQVSDPQLGLKVALSYFALLAFQLVLLAAVIILFTVFSKGGSGKGAAFRAGFGLLIPAAGVLVAHLVLLRRTNQERFPGVRRLFMGYNLAVTGLVGFAALLFAFQMFFKRGSAGDEGRLAIAGLLVYVGAWVACGIQFGRVVFGDPSEGPPSNVVPPSAPTPITPQQSGPTLPSLGAGSYPPIDQK
jgi:hypothetical protein